MVAEDHKEVKEKGDDKAVNGIDEKELHDTGGTGCSRGPGNYMKRAYIPGMSLNPDPPKNESIITVAGVRPIATGVKNLPIHELMAITPTKMKREPMWWDHVK